jgi:hypothetical protein
MTTQSTNTARRALGPRAILPHPRAVQSQVVSTSTTHGFRDLSTPASNSRSLSTLLDSSRDFVRDLSLAGRVAPRGLQARGSLACFAERSRSGATCDDPRRASPSPTLLSHAVNVRSWARNHPTTTHPTILSAARAGRKTNRRAGHARHRQDKADPHEIRAVRREVDTNQREAGALLREAGALLREDRKRRPLRTSGGHTRRYS